MRSLNARRKIPSGLHPNRPAGASAVVWVSGSGSVRLLTETAHLTTQRSGSGSVIRPNEGQ